MISFSVIITALQHITPTEIFDIMLVALALYIVALFIKQTRSYLLAGVVVVLIGIHLLSQNLNLTLTRSIVQPAYTFVFIIIAIVFQRDLRRFFKWIVIGRLDVFTNAKQISKGASAEIAEALLYMAEKKIGAIVVFPGRQDIDDMLEGGQPLGGDITKEILLSIFDSSSPGHDGAVVIDGNSIRQFGVHLPLAREYDGYRKAGTRHRAAAGITEDTDTIAFVVSEERGVISMFTEGKMRVLSDEKELRSALKDLTGESEVKHTSFWHYFLINNIGTKLFAIIFSLTLWIFFFAQTGVIKKEYNIPLSFQLLPPTLEIDANSGKKLVQVIVEGKSSDINNLSADKIEVRVDAKDFGTGTQNIVLTPSMINLPSFIQVSDINPDAVRIIVKEKGL